MPDFLDVLAHDASKTISEGYYQISKSIAVPNLSLKGAILRCTHAPIIAELKIASPSTGIIRKNVNPEAVAEAMKQGGAVGLSILTQPHHFHGSLQSLIQVRKQVQLPLLMKDIIVHPTQLEIASKSGANAILLITTLFNRGYTRCSLEEMIAYAHSQNLEVLLEVHTEDEFHLALSSDADLIGINNRDLTTLKVDLTATLRLLRLQAKQDVQNKVIVSESGIRTPKDIQFLHRCGAHAFLVGSTIMAAADIEGKVKELVHAL